MATRLDEILNDRTGYPDDRKITLADGVEVSLGDLRGGYLRDADYRRKTQALADERRRFDEERVANESTLTQAREELVKMAERANATTSADTLTTDEQIDQLLQRDPAARRLLSRIDALDKKNQALEQQWSARLDNEKKAREASIVAFHQQTLAKLREADPTLDQDALIAYAHQNGIARLDVAHRDMTREQAWATKEKAIREDERTKAEALARTQQPILPLRRTVTTPLSGEHDPKTFEEAAAAAERDPEIQQFLSGQAGG